MSRKRDWSEYNKQLVQRGSISFLVDPKMFEVKKACGMERPQVYSDPLIMMLMMTKIHLQLPYRSLQGFAKSLLDKDKGAKALIPPPKMGREALLVIFVSIERSRPQTV